MLIYSLKIKTKNKMLLDLFHSICGISDIFRGKIKLTPPKVGQIYEDYEFQYYKGYLGLSKYIHIGEKIKEELIESVQRTLPSSVKCEVKFSPFYMKIKSLLLSEKKEFCPFIEFRQEMKDNFYNSDPMTYFRCEKLLFLKFENLSFLTPHSRNVKIEEIQINNNSDSYISISVEMEGKVFSRKYLIRSLNLYLTFDDFLLKLREITLGRIKGDASLVFWKYSTSPDGSKIVETIKV